MNPFLLTVVLLWFAASTVVGVVVGRRVYSKAISNHSVPVAIVYGVMAGILATITFASVSDFLIKTSRWLNGIEPFG